jgi:hypothetical protein
MNEKPQTAIRPYDQNKPYEQKPYEQKPYEQKKYQDGVDTFEPSKPKAPAPLLDLKLYQQSKPPPPKPQFPYPVNVPTPFFPPQYMYNPYALMQSVQPMQPIIKNYSINVSGPTTNHGTVGMIYEDMLPAKQFTNTSNTLSERLSIHSFVRSVLLKYQDGEDISLDSTDSNSLMRYLKFMELNPYSTYKFSDNPYKGLPNNMLIYRSCYPIRYDQTTNSVACAKNSVGINIRIYKLTNAEYNVNKNDKIEFNTSDVWREICYYEYIREQILKQNQSPNFASMYSYYLCQKCNIDFDKIISFKGEQANKEEQYISTNDWKDLRNINDVDKGLINPTPVPVSKNTIARDIANIIESKNNSKNTNNDNSINFVQQLEKSSNLKCICDSKQKQINVHINGCPAQLTIKSECKCTLTQKHLNKHSVGCPLQVYVGTIIQSNPNAYSGAALIALTESPNYNIYNWASRVYQVDGNVKRMLNTGYHDEKVWHSILFQLMSALYVMQINKIAFRNFTLDDNVYVKDLSVTSNVTSYWKYKIDGIDYYIPNYGYLLLIDSNFKDITQKSYDTKHTLVPRKSNEDKPYKLCSNIFWADDNNPNYDKTDLDNMCFESFLNAFSQNNFSKSFTNDSGVKPPDKIIKLLSDICHDINASNKQNKNIGYYVYTFMRKFMNNRIGTYLKESEIPHLRKEDNTPPIKGQLLVHEVQFGTYKFVLYISDAKTPGQSTILTKKDGTNDIIQDFVPSGILYNYNRAEQPTQNFKINEANLNEEDLLETYIITNV